MEIKAAEVMKLRKMTGAGMMDCKQALQEADGDFDRAQDIIREKGKLIANKRADRTASEGVVVTHIEGKRAYMLCLACETDFVAKNAEFSASARGILDLAVAADAKSLEELLAVRNAEGRTVAELVTEKSGQTGEKVELPYYARIEAPYCTQYVHINFKLGTMLGFDREIPYEVAHDLAMQATAMAPVSIDESDCPADVLDKERQIGREQARLDGKPEKMLDQIAEGKVRKFLKECTLLNQALVKNPKMTVRQFLEGADPQAKIIAYKRFSLND